MQDFKRFAVYYAPEPGPLADFGAAWLGWDAVAGREVAHPPLPGLPRPVAELTATPRRYGFHATLKPPFRLARAVHGAELDTALRDLAGRLAPVTLDALEITRLGPFLALTPRGGTRALAHLAERVVADLDGYRAPLTPEERARRRAAGLSARQEALLDTWGYPYVMDEFRFHLTLTGPLPPAEAATTEAALAQALSPLLPCPFRLASLCLFAEGQDGRFRLLSRYSLAG